MHNTLFNIVALVSNAVIAFFLVRFFLGRLGVPRYGVWLILGSLFRYRGILGMGLNSAVNRYVPIFLAKDDRDGLQRVMSTALAFFIAMAAVGVLLVLIVYWNVDSWFVIEPDLLTVAGWVVLLAGGFLALSMPLQPFSAVLSGLQRYDLLNLAEFTCLILRTILIIVLLLRGHGLIAMALVFGISEIVARLAQYVFVRRLLPDVSVSIKSIDLKLLREMIPYGVNTFLYATGVIIMLKASEWVIAITLDTSLIPQFYAAATAVLLLSQFLQAFTRAIKPAISDLDARDDNNRVEEIAFLTQKYSLLLIIPGACFLAMMGREFLWVWVGEKFSDPGLIDKMAIILAILAVAHCVRLTQQSNFMVLVGRGEHRVFGLLTALAALACIGASVFSVKVLNMGLVGIAWANFLPIVLISGVILPIYFNWKMKISWKRCVARVWWPAILGSLPGVVLICAWKKLAPPASWPAILAVVATAMLVTLAAGWTLSLSTVERRRFRSVLSRR